MRWQDKFIPLFLLAQAAMSVVTLILQSVVGGGFSRGWAIAVPLILVAVVAGIGALKGLRWARMTIVVVYAVQILSYVSPAFSFDLWLGFHFKLSLSWIGTGTLGVNLLALAMTAWAGSRWFPHAPAQTA